MVLDQGCIPCHVLFSLDQRGATLRQPRLGAEHLHPLFGIPQVRFSFRHGSFGLLHLGDEGALVEQIQALPGLHKLSAVEQLLLDVAVHPGTNLYRVQGVRGAGIFRIQGHCLWAYLNDADSGRRGTGGPGFGLGVHDRAVRSTGAETADPRPIQTDRRRPLDESSDPWQVSFF